MKKNMIYKIIFLSLITLLIYYLNKKFNIIYIPSGTKVRDYQFNFFTVSTVFSGFLFTALGLVLGIYDDKIIEKLGSTVSIYDKCMNIIKGIIFCCLSTLWSILIIIGKPGANNFLLKYRHDIYSIAYLFVISNFCMGLLYFILSIRSLVKLVNMIYEAKDNRQTDKKKFDNAIKKQKEYINMINTKKDI